MSAHTNEPPQRAGEPHKIRRRDVRERVLQVLYAYQLSGEPIADVVSRIFDELRQSKDDFEFGKKLITDVLYHEPEVEGIIKKKVAHWEYERIALIDKLLLRMGICELLFFSDIPPKVTINETIVVAKAYSTENSGKFINGILNAILDDLKTTRTLRKSGRGLINHTMPAAGGRSTRNAKSRTGNENHLKQPPNIPLHPYTKKPLGAKPPGPPPPHKKPNNG